MKIEPDLEAIGSADLDEHASQNGSACQQGPTELFREPGLAKDGAQDRTEQHRQQNTGARVQQHSAAVNNSCRRKCIEIDRGNCENQDETKPPAAHNSLTPSKISIAWRIEF